MKTLQINEGDQTIVGPVNVDSYVPANEFVARLVEEAKVTGKAIAADDDGCEVTAIIK